MCRDDSTKTGRSKAGEEGTFISVLSVLILRKEKILYPAECL